MCKRQRQTEGLLTPSFDGNYQLQGKVVFRNTSRDSVLMYEVDGASLSYMHVSQKDSDGLLECSEGSSSPAAVLASLVKNATLRVVWVHLPGDTTACLLGFGLSKTRANLPRCNV